jgi:hypothetical protein
VCNAWNQRKEVPALNRLASSERNRAHSSTVKRAYESNEQLSPCVPSRQLCCALNGFGTAVAEENSLFPIARSELSQFFRQIHNFTVQEVSVRIMQVPISLLLDSLNNFGMIVPHIQANKPGIEVDVFVAVNIA